MSPKLYPGDSEYCASTLSIVLSELNCIGSFSKVFHQRCLFEPEYRYFSKVLNLRYEKSHIINIKYYYILSSLPNNEFMKIKTRQKKK